MTTKTNEIVNKNEMVEMVEGIDVSNQRIEFEMNSSNEEPEQVLVTRDDVCKLASVPRFLTLGKSQKYLNKIVNNLGWYYDSENSKVPNEGHEQIDLRITYAKQFDTHVRTIQTPLMRNEFGVFNGVERDDWAINTIRFIAIMAWLQASIDERVRVINEMELDVSEDTMYRKIPKSYAYINTIVSKGLMNEFMEIVGYEPSNIFVSNGHCLCWKLQQHAWKSRDWLKFNHNHKNPIAINRGDYENINDAIAAVVVSAWRRLQPYYKVEGDILKPLNII